ncbi:protein of unknown function DUF1304 [Olsenella uli DSM 7084]|uniref:Integral membrane protein n=1 Tax=Olsenella uli (strain ATCC 49627 / DSM 7084 / CCUG 31166 / CIP 109912 / JCM 12494 / LMG 11480 / NCIMB 702895 / VPI D76D-27C) TaxID=633147 RepID=E1QYE4_OLSUV|nr:DUF1304 domain-containing protein [Olsenella uli]ADK67408.1 protein of unknown function DUF1304 [Olsenella uli DSM 7084]EUB31789.1 PF06993 family protein [Olsenella uli MSTE5]KRO11944.1 hypothetical protein IV77_GL001755 [Olsenella uli DSM 7084]
MDLVTIVLATLVAVEFLYIMYLEAFATTSEKTAQVFGMPVEELGRDSVRTLFKNQGIYNGLVAVMVLVSVYLFASLPVIIMLMCFIILVALYGSLTSNPRIILMQGGLAILTLLSAIWTLLV